MGGSRSSAGPIVAGVGALALVVVMLAFDWYGLDGFNETYSAWEAYSLIRFGLVAVAVLAIAFGLAALARPGVNLGWLSMLTAAAATVALAVIAIRAASPPDVPVGGRSAKGAGIEINAEIGVFLGLVAIAAIVVGAVIATRMYGATLGGELRRLGGALGEAPADEPPQPGPTDGRSDEH